MSSQLIYPNTLKAICGEDKALLEELLTLFQEQAPLQLQTLARALETHAYDAIKIAAHTLKGSASYVGAQAMVELCQKLEQAALSHEAQDCKYLLTELENSFSHTQKALGAEFGL